MTATASKSKADEFDAPDETTGISWEELKGHLIVVEPIKLEEGIKTSFGDADAMRANVYDVSGKESHLDTLIFPKVLISSLKNKVGRKVLAKVGQGVAKPGQSAPWVLEDMSGNEKARNAASAFMATAAKSKPAAPKVEESTEELEDWSDDAQGDDIPF